MPSDGPWENKGTSWRWGCGALSSGVCFWLTAFISVSLPRNSRRGPQEPFVTGVMLPWWELSFYLLVSIGFHFYSFYEVYKVSRGKVLIFLNLCQKSKVGAECLEVEGSGRSVLMGTGWLEPLLLLSRGLGQFESMT